MIGTGSKHGRLFLLDAGHNSFLASSTGVLNILWTIWNRCLDHLNHASLVSLFKFGFLGTVIDNKMLSSFSTSKCDFLFGKFILYHIKFIIYVLLYLWILFTPMSGELPLTSVGLDINIMSHLLMIIVLSHGFILQALNLKYSPFFKNSIIWCILSLTNPSKSFA